MRVPHGNHYTIFSVFLGNLQSHADKARKIGVVVAKREYCCRPQVSRQITRVDLK